MHNSNTSYEMARMTENINLQRALLKRLDECPEVRIMDKTKVDSIEQENAAGGWPVVRVSDGSALRARLLVRVLLLNCRVLGNNHHHFYPGWR